MKNLIISLAILLSLNISAYTKENGYLYPEHTISWNQCKNSNKNFMCSSIRVPLAYDNPELGSIRLPVMLHKSTQRKLGTIFLNFGGPWANNVSILPSLIKTRLPKQWTKNFDLIVFNPRGTAPNLVSCSPSDTKKYNAIQDKLKKAFLEPNTIKDSEIFILTTKLRTLCKYNDLSKYVGTHYVVNDMEQLRQSLHIDQFNFYGDSYGARLGVAYLFKYSANIRSIILDANFAPTNSFESLIESRAKGASIAYNAFLNYCIQSKHNCALYRNQPAKLQTVTTLKKKLQSLINRAEKQGIPTSGKYRKTALTSGMIQYILYSQMNPSILPKVASALDEAIIKNSGDALMSIYIDMTGFDIKKNSFPVDDDTIKSAVFCKDFNINQNHSKYHEWKNLVDNIQAKYGDIGKVASMWLIPKCIDWPEKSEPLLSSKERGNNNSNAKILIIGNTIDPMMPYSNDLSLYSYLKSRNYKVRILRWHAYGHTALLSNPTISKCVYEQVNHLFTFNQFTEVSSCMDWKNPFIPKQTSNHTF